MVIYTNTCTCTHTHTHTHSHTHTHTRTRAHTHTHAHTRTLLGEPPEAHGTKTLRSRPSLRSSNRRPAEKGGLVYPRRRRHIERSVEGTGFERCESGAFKTANGRSATASGGGDSSGRTFCAPDPTSNANVLYIASVLCGEAPMSAPQEQRASGRSRGNRS